MSALNIPPAHQPPPLPPSPPTNVAPTAPVAPTAMGGDMSGNAVTNPPATNASATAPVSQPSKGLLGLGFFGLGGAKRRKRGTRRKKVSRVNRKRSTKRSKYYRKRK